MALHVLHVLGWYKQEPLLSYDIHRDLHTPRSDVILKASVDNINLIIRSDW